MIIELWTDGSGTTSGPIGWAFVLRAINEDGEVVSERTGGGFDIEGTNNRAEMMALLEGLGTIVRPSKVRVFTDSEYLMKPFTEGYLEKWAERDWHKLTGGPVKNADLWRQIRSLAQPHEITVEYVEGHTGVPLNERCDRLAGACRRALVAELSEQEQAA